MCIGLPRGIIRRHVEAFIMRYGMQIWKNMVEIFLMGDFNINISDRTSPQTKELETTTALWGLNAQVKGHTRLGSINGQLSGSCIDNIYTNSEAIAAAGVLDWNFSDHLVVAVKRKRSKIVRSKVEFVGRSYKNYSREDLQDNLLQWDWGQFYESEDPNLCWDVLENEIRSYLDRTCPSRAFRVKEVKEQY